MNGGVPLLAPGTPGEEPCEEIINLAVAIVTSFRCLIRHHWGDVKSDKRLGMEM